eukprot:1156978-Pelagomonas_calceolata.AAC.3
MALDTVWLVSGLQEPSSTVESSTRGCLLTVFVHCAIASGLQVALDARIASSVGHCVAGHWPSKGPQVRTFSAAANCNCTTTSAAAAAAAAATTGVAP